MCELGPRPLDQPRDYEFPLSANGEPRRVPQEGMNIVGWSGDVRLECSHDNGKTWEVPPTPEGDMVLIVPGGSLLRLGSKSQQEEAKPNWFTRWWRGL